MGTFRHIGGTFLRGTAASSAPAIFFRRAAGETVFPTPAATVPSPRKEGGAAAKRRPPLCLLGKDWGG